MKWVKCDAVDQTFLILLRDSDGLPATSMAAAGIDIAYVRVLTDNDVVTSDVTPNDLASLTAAHNDWGVKEVSATDHPGVYRIDVADAVFVAGATSAVVTITGGVIVPTSMEFTLTGDGGADGPSAAVWDAARMDFDTALTFGEVVTTTDLVAAIFAKVIETYTFEELLTIILAATAGKSDHTGATRHYRNQADTVDRITATTSSGDRTAVTINVSDL